MARPAAGQFLDDRDLRGRPGIRGLEVQVPGGRRHAQDARAAPGRLHLLDGAGGGIAEAGQLLFNPGDRPVVPALLLPRGPRRGRPPAAALPEPGEQRRPQVGRFEMRSAAAAARSTHRQPLAGDHSGLRFSSSQRRRPASSTSRRATSRMPRRSLSWRATATASCANQPSACSTSRQSPTLRAALQEDAGSGGVRDQAVAAWHVIGTPGPAILPSKKFDPSRRWDRSADPAMTFTAEKILDQPIAGENAGFDVFDRGGVPTIERGRC